MYQTVEVTHYFSLFVLIGTTVLVDLRVLGIAARRQTIAQISRQLPRRFWIALSLCLLSGFVMFTADAGDYYCDWVFRTKMVVVLLAIIFTIIVQKSASRQDQPEHAGAVFKLVAGASLVLWIGAILAAVEIAAISGLG